ncbi:hypothetical protein T08_4610, partial [Trichinella sp. T8]
LMRAGRFEIFRLDQLLRSPVQPINRRNLFSTTVTLLLSSSVTAHQQTSAAIFSLADVESMGTTTTLTAHCFCAQGIKIYWLQLDNFFINSPSLTDFLYF